MKTSGVLRLTMWLAERGGRGATGEAFAGDLMETLAHGGSRWWCLLQAAQRALLLASLRTKALLVPTAYCIAFVFLFPLWQRLNAPTAERLLNGSSNSIAWPGSAMLELVTGLLPAVIFVWVGVFGFLLLRPALRLQDLGRVTVSLSFGCSMVSAETMLRLGGRPPELIKLSHPDFYYPVCHAHFSVILFVALLAAISLLPREQDSADRPKWRQFPGRWSLLRLVRSVGLMTLLASHGAAQEMRPQGPAAKRLVKLVEQFDGEDWRAFTRHM